MEDGHGAFATRSDRVRGQRDADAARRRREAIRRCVAPGLRRLMLPPAALRLAAAFFGGVITDGTQETEADEHGHEERRSGQGAARSSWGR